MRTRTCIDFDWRFELGDSPEAMGASFDATAWRQLDLPHDWSIEATAHPDNPAQAGGGFFPGGIGWYRKQIDIPATLGDDHVLIEFDGVYMNSEVWCNGHSLGVRPYGYSSFCYDLTPYVTPGEAATIAVRVDNAQQKNSRWYSGSGIYRHVWLTIAGPVRVDHWGTTVTTPEVSTEKAVVACAVRVVNDIGADAGIDVCATLVDAECPSVDSRSLLRQQVDLLQPGTVDLTIDLPNPRLWSPESPHLYTLRVTIERDGEVLDTYDTRFGIRTLRFDADEGFFLNGESLKMMGVNEHHDAGCLGAAVPDDVIRRRFRILKDMGCNAIRVAHNPASPTFLDLCDEMGLMVVEDAFDEWKDGKTPFGYGLYWDDWWERDLVDMIRRDRNHACIVMWSVGNEIKEVREGRPEGLPIMQALRDVCHREDPTRLMTCGCCNTRETLAAGYGPLMDVVGYNGGGGSCFDYEKDHAAYPEMLIFASEVPHSLQTRGVYRTRSWYRDLARNPDVERMDVPHLTEEECFTEFDEHYQSSYDNAMVRISSIDSWRLTKTLPFMLGEFRWTGFDYIGECYRWPAKSWNFGVIDLCGFPKDTYYFYQSEWTCEPMVHLLPHWTWPGLEGKRIPVIAYSNCERVELFLDGESLGVQTMDREVMQLRWDVPYRPGELKAVGYGDGNLGGSLARQRVDVVGEELSSAEHPPAGAGGYGEETVEGTLARQVYPAGGGGVDVRGGVLAACVHTTAGEAAAISVCSDEPAVRADRTGIAHVAITIVDAQGRFVPHASHEVTVEVDGPARLIGLENGDPIDSTNYKLDHRKAFSGMLLAIVQAGDTPGTVTIRAKAEGLSGATCTVEASPER